MDDNGEFIGENIFLECSTLFKIAIGCGNQLIKYCERTENTLFFINSIYFST